MSHFPIIIEKLGLQRFAGLKLSEAGFSGLTELKLIK